MAEIRPFRGIRYNPKRVHDFDQVVSPPYDVIGPALQADLYRRSAYNIVRVDFGMDLPGDDDLENRHTRAARLLDDWLAQGVLIQDRECSIYYLEESYRGEFGEQRTRKGFLASVRLEDPESGLYRPHEKTLAGPKADRLKLMQACRANLSPIFSLYHDESFTVLRDLETVPLTVPPLVTVDAGRGEVTRLWRVGQPGVIRGVAAAMRLKSFFIADGHHRYETALMYRNLMREITPGYSGREPWNYVLMYFTNMEAPGLSVFPTHRAVFGMKGFDLKRFLDDCRNYFDVEALAGGSEVLGARMKAARGGGHVFGVAAAGTPELWLLTLRDESVMTRLLAGRAHRVVQSLDVTVLHSLILE
ncbi:MAG: DUF1015 domain-containing protein, partial [Deferrisomatales bacterium]